MKPVPFLPHMLMGIPNLSYDDYPCVYCKYNQVTQTRDMWSSVLDSLLNRTDLTPEERLALRWAVISLRTGRLDLEVINGHIMGRR